MTHKEKATELVNKYIDVMPFVPSDVGVDLPSNGYAKILASIAVEEIIQVLDVSDLDYPDEIKLPNNYNQLMEAGKKYWQQVKKEIASL